jgi:hypothetical protein
MVRRRRLESLLILFPLVDIAARTHRSQIFAPARHSHLLLSSLLCSTPVARLVHVSGYRAWLHPSSTMPFLSRVTTSGLRIAAGERLRPLQGRRPHVTASPYELSTHTHTLQYRDAIRAGLVRGVIAIITHIRLSLPFRQRAQI